MPGINVRTDIRTGPIAGSAPASARYFVGGLTERGAVTEPVLVRSMADYKALLGDRVAYGSLYDDLATFFEEGGAEAYVCRAVGADAEVGTLTLDDKAVSAVDTLRVDATNPGAWSTRLTVEVAAGTESGRYKLVIRLDGTIVHTFDNLDTPADAVAAAQGSNYVTITSLGSVTAYPNNQPKVLAATALSAGDDDRAAVTAADVVTALGRAGHDFGTGAVATPGFTSTQVGALLLAHATTHSRLALLATAVDDTVEDAKDAAADLTATGGEYAGLFYPWIVVPDGNSTRTISPEGYVAACRVRALRVAGAWIAPAGDIAVAKYVLAPSVAIDKSTGDDLDDARVSAIRTIASTVRLYGWKSLSSDNMNFALLTGRDVLNYLSYAGEAVLEQYVFKTIDGRGQLLGRVASTLVGLLDPIRASGGFFEKRTPQGGLDRGYSIDVGPSVNTDAELAANKIAATIAVRVSPIGSLIELTITKAGLAASV